MNLRQFFSYLLVMAGVTYAIRMVPLAVIRKKINSDRIKSFLYYVPFTVLGAMTFPAILYSTGDSVGNLISAVAGLCVAVALAWFEKGLLTVAVSACGAAFMIQLGLRIFGI